MPVRWRTGRHKPHPDAAAAPARPDPHQPRFSRRATIPPDEMANLLIPGVNYE